MPQAKVAMNLRRFIAPSTLRRTDVKRTLCKGFALIDPICERLSRVRPRFADRWHGCSLKNQLDSDSCTNGIVYFRHSIGFAEQLGNCLGIG